VKAAAAVLMVLAGWPLAAVHNGLARLWPALAALVLVWLLRQPLGALLLGAFSGCLVLHAQTPWRAVPELLSGHVVASLQSSWNASALLFTLLMGGFVALIDSGGSLAGMARRWLERPQGNSARRVQVGAWVFGLVCFFDGLANAMLAGRLFRPLFDRARVPRAMLAYIVDSTSAPVACVAFISTWIAFQLSLIASGFSAAGREANPYEVFMASLPANYYCWFTLLLVVLAVWLNWHPGPMARAESTPPEEQAEASGETAAWRGVLPVAVLVGGILTGLYVDGAGWLWPDSLRDVAGAFGAADAARVLLTSSVVACGLAVLVHPRPQHAPAALVSGMLSLAGPAAILLGAWALGSVLKELETAAWIARGLEGTLPAGLLPAAVFLLAAACSFCTGTSWGTMGVVMPLALPSALALAGPASGPEMMVAGASVTAAVFSGAVFGDHCSPLSDTTIVSAAASGTPPLEHVRTQMPYALTAAAAALLLGFLPLGLLGLPSWIPLSGGAAALAGWVIFQTRRRAG
jgi:Na+/H+ antiporter NhaC